MNLILTKYGYNARLFITSILTHCLSLSISVGQSQISFVNRSSFNIDSIVVEGYKSHNLGEIKIGKVGFIDLSEEIANFHSIVPCSYSVYYNEMSIKRQCNEFLRQPNASDSIYIFDNGISEFNNLLRPTFLSLLFTNNSNRQINSFSSESKSIVKLSELTPRFFRFEFVFDRIQDRPNFNVELDAKSYTIDLGFHNFDNWNDTLVEVWFENDSLHAGEFPIEKSKEYILDIDIDKRSGRDLQEAGLLTAITDALTKTYSFDLEHASRKRFVFDRNKLSSNPNVQILFGKKRFILNFKEQLLNSSSNFGLYQMGKGGLVRKG